MHHDIAALLELRRQEDGRFGERQHSEPEQQLAPSRPLVVAVPTEVVHTTPRRGPFRRQVLTMIQANIWIDEVDRESTVEGDRGELILSGQAYLPARRGDAHAPADQAALTALGRHAAADLPELPDNVEDARQAVERHLNRRPRAGAIIDGMLWVRASHAASTQF